MEASVEFVYDTQVVNGEEKTITWAEVTVGDRISVFLFEHPHANIRWTYIHTIDVSDVNHIDPFLEGWGGRSLDQTLPTSFIEEVKKQMREFDLDRNTLKSVVCHVSGKEAGSLWTLGYQVLIDLTDEERGVEVIAVYSALPEWRESELRQDTPQLDKRPEVGDKPNLEMLQWRA